MASVFVQTRPGFFWFSLWYKDTCNQTDCRYAFTWTWPKSSKMTRYMNQVSIGSIPRKNEPFSIFIENRWNLKVPVVQSNGQFGDNGLTVTTPNGLNKDKSPILRVLRNMVKSSDSRDTANSEHVTTDSGKGESEHESLSSHHQVTNNNYRYENAPFWKHF